MMVWVILDSSERLYDICATEEIAEKVRPLDEYTIEKWQVATK